MNASAERNRSCAISKTMPTGLLEHLISVNASSHAGVIKAWLEPVLHSRHLQKYIVGRRNMRCASLNIMPAYCITIRLHAKSTHRG
eukprot:5589134-Pleurochrysis_carterae.AAC.1